jgi:hypothetical protein
MIARYRRPVVAAILVALPVGVAAAIATGQAADQTSRYPYDPACPWGRVANGKGMIVRCLNKTEAELLVARGTTGVRPPAPSVSTPASASAAPSASAVAGTDAIGVQVGPVLVDEGKLPQAEKKLAVPKDRYAECVAKNGGLSAKTAEVHVRFLVRARGRAEGVSVAKRTGVTLEAARCVADVVDRRLVGTPDAPMVGATLVVKFTSTKTP